MWLLYLLCVATTHAAAQERFESVETRVNLSSAGLLSVHHDIVVTSTGDEIKRGIFLALPPSIGPISDLRVTRDGAPENYRWQAKKRRLLRIGRKDTQLEPGQHRYTLGYQAKRPFWLHSDETLKDGSGNTITLSWRPLMAKSELAWVSSHLEITWPEETSPTEAPGETTKSWHWRGPTGEPSDGQTYEKSIVLSWAEDEFPANTIRKRLVSPVLRYGAPVGLIILWLMFHLTWQSVGRNRKPGLISSIAHAPDGISPASARYIMDMAASRESIAGAIMSLVTKGVMTLRKDGKSITLTLTGDMADPLLSSEERALVQEVFKDERKIVLKKRVSRFLKGTWVLTKSLQTDYRGRMYNTNKGPWWRVMALVGLFAAFIVYQLIPQEAADAPDKVGLVLGLISLIAAPLIGVIYLSHFKTPTSEGRNMMDQIEGLKRHLTATDPLRGSDVDPIHFLALLPYAVALNVEDDWRKRFGPELDNITDTNAVELLAWYRSWICDDNGIPTSTFVVAILPAITASTATGAGTVGAGGATAGGW
jgi:hypothetical protein